MFTEALVTLAKTWKQPECPQTDKRIKKTWYTYPMGYSVQFSSFQLLSRVRLFATPWITACYASLSITNSQSWRKLMSIKSVMPSSHLILCCPLLLLPSIPPGIRVFSSELLFASGGQSIRVSVSTSVLPMNIQDWFPLGWTGWISLQSKHHSSKMSILLCSAFFMVQLLHPCWKNHSFD